LHQENISYIIRTKTEAMNVLEGSMKTALGSVQTTTDLTYFGVLKDHICVPEDANKNKMLLDKDYNHSFMKPFYVGKIEAAEG
jgi:hypothetical protein